MQKYRIGIEIDRRNHSVGTLEVFDNRGKEFYRFQYADEWIDRPFAFEIDPMLPMKKGFPYHESRLWGSSQDISPDRWGRLLQERFSSPGEASAIKYLLGVSDSI